MKNAKATRQRSFALVIAFTVTLAPFWASAEDKSMKRIASIHRKLPPFEFEIRFSDHYSGTVRVSGGSPGFKEQSLVLEDIGVMEYMRNSELLHIEDYNFDGYKDLGVLVGMGATGNCSFNYWVYDSDMKTFVRACELDDMNGIDPKGGYLFRSWKFGGNEWLDETYRVVRGKPVLVESKEHKPVSDARDIVPKTYEDMDFVEITRIYRNGRNVRTFYRLSK